MDARIRDYFNDKVLGEAAACFGVSIQQLNPLRGFENFIYEFEQDGKAYILRITHNSRRTKEMVEAEMHWIEYLHRGGVNCSLPLKSIHGNLVELICEGEHRFVACAFDKVPGCRITEALDTRQLRYNYGKQVGRMHQLTKDYQPGALRRIEWYEDELIREFKHIVPAEQSTVLARMQENTRQILAMEPNRENYGLIHFDVHAGNFFVHHDDIYIFDFDDSQYAFFAADIAIVMFYFASNCPPNLNRDDFITDFYRDFMQGYVSENYLPELELAKIPIFLKQRELILYAAILHAYQGRELDGWAAWYMTDRKEKLEQEQQYLNVNFT